MSSSAISDRYRTVDHGRQMVRGVEIAVSGYGASNAASAAVRKGLWYEVFAIGHPVLKGKHRRYGWLPAPPRCKLCRVPFHGVGWVMRSRGWQPSPRNEDYCSVCDLFIRDHEGVADVVLPLVFTDLCNSTLLGQTLPNADYGRRRKVYRSEIAQALRKTDGFILEESGDQVVGIFPPGLIAGRHLDCSPEDAVGHAAGLAVDCALELATNTTRRVTELTGFTFGSGVHIGDVRISAAFRPDGSGAAVEINGPSTNLAARLAGICRPGDVLVTDELVAASGRALETYERHTFAAYELKGVADTVGVRIVNGAAS